MITQMVLVGLIIFNILILILSFMLYTMILNIKYQVNQIHTAMSNIIGKMLTTEMVLGKLVSAFSEFTESSGEMFDQLAMNMSDGDIRNVYRTMDGRYSSNTLEGLINKIKKDGKEKDYLTDDMDQLRNLFESEDDLFDGDEDLDDTIR